jgi:hypothetical protein
MRVQGQPGQHREIMSQTKQNKTTPSENDIVLTPHQQFIFKDIVQICLNMSASTNFTTIYWSLVFPHVSNRVGTNSHMPKGGLDSVNREISNVVQAELWHQAQIFQL